MESEPRRHAGSHSPEKLAGAGQRSQVSQAEVGQYLLQSLNWQVAQLCTASQQTHNCTRSASTAQPLWLADQPAFTKQTRRQQPQKKRLGAGNMLSLACSGGIAACCNILQGSPRSVVYHRWQGRQGCFSCRWLELLKARSQAAKG